MSQISSSYLLQVTSELDVKVVFSLTILPDDDYDIEVASMFFQDLEGLQVFLSDIDHDAQKQLLETANDVVDQFITDNHERLYTEMMSNSKLNRSLMH